MKNLIIGIVIGTVGCIAAVLIYWFSNSHIPDEYLRLSLILKNTKSIKVIELMSENSGQRIYLKNNRKKFDCYFPVSGEDGYQLKITYFDNTDLKFGGYVESGYHPELVIKNDTIIINSWY